MAGGYTTPEYRTPRGDSLRKPAAWRYQFCPSPLPAPWRPRSKESSATTTVRRSAGVPRSDQTARQQGKRSQEQGCKAKPEGSTQNKNAGGSPGDEDHSSLPAV